MKVRVVDLARELVLSANGTVIYQLATTTKATTPAMTCPTTLLFKHARKRTCVCNPNNRCNTSGAILTFAHQRPTRDGAIINTLVIDIALLPLIMGQ
ncbi:unnamed protein product [Ceratitis capitata]|uniref:(Mediterranean fruit fly) hypothetical protein n=1 Tax=Ceratitis capitata TaxID=7213 RepID=A0A811U1D2_CERCA|nr:unnamed protein product [Ceratitis capitata]